jgi:hypothetical protein
MIAQKILKKYLEYICFWKAEFGAKNPPSEVLQRQLIALMKAVDIYPTHTPKDKELPFFDYFSSGKFLEQNTHTKAILEPILEKHVTKFIEESSHSRRLKGLLHRIDYARIYGRLLSYRIKIERLYIPPGIQLEGFGTFSRHFCEHQIKKTLDALTEATKDIDEILCLLINPSQKNITEEKLISEFGYPTENLNSIATDWFADGF